jgi:hypothetical protein
MRAYDTSNGLLAVAPLTWTGITNGVQTPGIVEIARPGADIAYVTMTTSAHATGGIWLGAVCHEPGAPAPTGDALIICVKNNNLASAAGLRATFTGGGGSLYTDVNTIVAPYCPPAVVPSNPPTNTATVAIDWGAECVPNGESVIFTVRTPNGPLTLTSATWTNFAGTSIGPADTCQVRPLAPVGPDPPPPPPPPPLWAFKVESIDIGGGKVRGFWVGPDGCPYRISCCLPRWTWSRVVFCPFANAFDMFFEIGPWFPISPWTHVGRPFTVYVKTKDTIVSGPFDAQLRQTYGPACDTSSVGSMGEKYDPEHRSLDPRYSRDGGTTYRKGADFSSTFLSVAHALTIMGPDANNLGHNDHPQFLQRCGPRYHAAAAALDPLLAELDIVRSQHPSSLLDAMKVRVIGLRSALNQVGNELDAASDTYAPPYDSLATALNSLASLIQSVPGARFQSASQRLAYAGGVATDLHTLVQSGIDVFDEKSTFAHLIYNRLRRALSHFANSMQPHMRVDLDLPDYAWMESTIQGVRVIVRRQDTGEVYMERILDLTDEGAFEVPLTGVADGTPLEIWWKLPTHLSGHVFLSAQDGAQLGPYTQTAGDANDDNCITSQDLSQISADFGQGGDWQGPGVGPSDVDGDGIVGLSDHSLTSSRLGLCGDSPPVGVEPIDLTAGPGRVRVFPNPTSGESALGFVLPRSASVSAEVYNVAGRRVATVLPWRRYEAGPVTLSMRTGHLAQGVYRVVVHTREDDGKLDTRSGSLVILR